MQKKIVRLTESDLHRIIKESVEQILSEAQLNELDPRTYASYAQKRAAQGNPMKANAGADAARSAWNKEYGSYNPNSKMYTKDGEKDAEEKTALYMKNDEDAWRQHAFTNNGKIEYEPYHSYYSKEIGNGYNPKYEKNIPLKGLSNYGSKVAKEMSDGSGKYVKGRGWIYQ
jgi:hypothetical protein